MTNPLFGKRNALPDETETFVVERILKDQITVTKLDDKLSLCELKWSSQSKSEKDNLWISRNEDIKDCGASFSKLIGIDRYDYLTEKGSEVAFSEYNFSLSHLVETDAQCIKQNFDSQRVLEIDTIRIPSRSLPVAHVMELRIDGNDFKINEVFEHLKTHPWAKKMSIEEERYGTHEDDVDEVLVAHLLPSQEEFDAYNTDMAGIEGWSLASITLPDIAVWPFVDDTDVFEIEEIAPCRRDPLGLSKFTKWTQPIN